MLDFISSRRTRSVHSLSAVLKAVFPVKECLFVEDPGSFRELGKRGVILLNKLQQSHFLTISYFYGGYLLKVALFNSVTSYMSVQSVSRQNVNKTV